MSLDAICQLCGDTYFDWQLKQTEISVGQIQYYKIQACPNCTKKLELALKSVLFPGKK